MFLTTILLIRIPETNGSGAQGEKKQLRNKKEQTQKPEPLFEENFKNPPKRPSQRGGIDESNLNLTDARVSDQSESPIAGHNATTRIYDSQQLTPDRQQNRRRKNWHESLSFMNLTIHTKIFLLEWKVG